MGPQDPWVLRRRRRPSRFPPEGNAMTRFTPLITFVLDQGVKKSIEITRLINEALGKPLGVTTSEEEEPGEGEEASPHGADAADGTADGGHAGT